jgi:hypothetical protein
VCIVFSQLPVEAFCPLRELVILDPFKTMVCNNSLFVWHCFWYSLCLSVCVT